jgi:ankyrin repeat protein
MLSRIGSLLKIGARIDQPNDKNQSPVEIVHHYMRHPPNDAARHVYAEIHKLFRPALVELLCNAVDDNNIDKAHKLLAVEADPNGINKFGYRPLNLAQTPEMVDLLCNFRADVNKPNQWGDTPLHVAIFNGDLDTGKPNKEVVKTLILRGAKTDMPNQRKNTPAEMALQAAQRGSLVNGQMQTKANLSDEARIEYAEILPHLCLPQYLWPRLRHGN